jgi:neutral trehalase
LLKIKLSYTDESQEAAYRELDRIIRSYTEVKSHPPRLDPKTGIYRAYIEVKETPKNCSKH